MNIVDINFLELKSLLQPRDKNSHKGMYGNVLVIGGDYGMPGSVRIAAEGALRVGAGVVTVVTRMAHIMAVVASRPELLCYGIDNNFDILRALVSRANVIVLGPGLGQSDWSISLFNSVIATNKALIIDADGLNILAKKAELSKKSYVNWILTPHPGEAARLLNTTIEYIQQNREQSALKLQQKYGCTIVLKGYNSLIANNHNTIKRCLSGNPGMATAGMGDLLSGVIAGLVAEGLTLGDAAELGVEMHARAGDRAIAKLGTRSVLASDLLLNLY